MIAAANRPDGTFEKLRGLLLRNAFIEEQIHDLSFVFWELRDALVELGPFGKVLWLLVELREGTILVIWSLMIGVVVVANAMWPEVLSAEVDELSSYLGRGQVEEVPDALNFNIGKSPMQADHRVLKHIVRLLPSPQARAVMKHPAGEQKESITGVVEQLLLGGCVTLQSEVDEALEVGVGAVSGGG